MGPSGSDNWLVFYTLSPNTSRPRTSRSKRRASKIPIPILQGQGHPGRRGVLPRYLYPYFKAKDIQVKETCYRDTYTHTSRPLTSRSETCYRDTEIPIPILQGQGHPGQRDVLPRYLYPYFKATDIQVRDVLPRYQDTYTHTSRPRTSRSKRRATEIPIPILQGH